MFVAQQRGFAKVEPMPNRAVSRLVTSAFSEDVVIKAAREARTDLGAEVSCALVFFSPGYVEHLEEFLELIRVYGRVPLLLGCTGSGLIGTRHEAEDQAGFSLLLLSLPKTRLHVLEFSQKDVEESAGPAAWRAKAGVSVEEVNAWITLVHPAQLDAERWLAEWNQAYPGVPTLGGLASGNEEGMVVCRDGGIVAGDALALGFSGGLRVQTIVSQGCRPIGEPLTITGARQNLLLTLGLQTGLRRPQHRFQRLDQAGEGSRAQQPLCRGGDE